MLYDRPLTGEQRRISQLNYNRFSAVNGASYMCLGETVIILFAVKLSAPNFIVAVIGAMMFLTGKWKKPGVYNVEEFDPDPFMEQLNKQGLPWHEVFNGDIEL